MCGNNNGILLFCNCGGGSTYGGCSNNWNGCDNNNCGCC